ncbi:TetR/AcrR family transcriptional regulator [Maridesulfovibrio zosterae]|uniref:TetR/AcrR family transcriptional regulator n=1 Tax=Maridesulfovibrio zosterae TaxID=82171 RepID=UPI000405B81A|nr:TetR/AcrR family transcriptional regulator [Maridesulfovibrio zosterae]
MKQYSEKETRILDTAAEMFANQPFHKVLLSDVARVACVGKGTLYLYFKSKDDLYFAVLFRGFATLVEKLEKHASQIDLTPTEQLTYIITDLAQHLLRKSINAQLLGKVIHYPDSGEWQDMRAKLWSLIELVIIRGIDEGEFEDSAPRLTAQYIPSLIRSISLFPPEGIDIETFCKHACTFVFKALKIEK